MEEFPPDCWVVQENIVVCLTFFIAYSGIY